MKQDYCHHHLQPSSQAKMEVQRERLLSMRLVFTAVFLYRHTTLRDTRSGYLKQHGGRKWP